MLKLKDIHCQYHDQTVINGSSFELKEGQLATLLGPSGCGKTTLLRCIAGFQAISQGEILLNNNSIANLAIEKRGIGFVFQDYALFPHLTVEKNILFGIHKQANKQERLKEVLSLVELEGMEKRFPHELSGGQQQRVALARALAPKPSLLLMDEPFSNLDADLRKSLCLQVRSLLKSEGITAILVTHDQAEAFSFSDYVGLMHDGVIQQWDNPYNLYHKPDNDFVAGFIGNGQLLDAKVIDDSTIHTDFGNIKHAATIDADINQILSRPEDWLIEEGNGGFSITEKRFEGTQTSYIISNPQEKTLEIAMPSHCDLELGHQVNLCPKFEHIITFKR